MKVIKAYPPNFAQIAAAFPVKGVPGIIYAYGDRIYAPDAKGPLSPWIMAHEEIHGAQQRTQEGWDVPKWWDRYTESPTFRLEQEIPAHRAEWAAFAKNFSGYVANYYLDQIAARLSGPLYGNLISKDRAIEEIVRA